MKKPEIEITIPVPDNMIAGKVIDELNKIDNIIWCINCGDEMSPKIYSEGRRTAIVPLCNKCFSTTTDNNLLTELIINAINSKMRWPEEKSKISVTYNKGG